MGDTTGKKRPLLVDTLASCCTRWCIRPQQDRDGGIRLLAALADRFPLLAKLFAEGASQGPLFPEAVAEVLPQLTTEIVKRDEQAIGFVGPPQALAWGADNRWAPSLSPVGQGFREPPSHCHSVRSARLHRLMLRKLCNPPELLGRL